MGAEQLPGVRRRLALAEELEGQDAAWPSGTVVLDETTVPSDDPDHVTVIGEQVAAALRRPDASLDGLLLSALESHASDPYFASALARSLTADELAEVAARLSYSTDPAAADARARVLVALGVALGTATRATGDLALLPGTAKVWSDLMAVTGADLTPATLTTAGTPSTARAASLASLLLHGTWDDDFVVDVVGRTIDLESAARGGGTGTLWQSVVAGGPLVGPKGADGAVTHDPLALLLDAAARETSVLQRILLAGPRVHIRAPEGDFDASARLDFLLTQRTWPLEEPPGTRVGALLEQATTTIRDREIGGRRSADITSQALALIGAATRRDAPVRRAGNDPVDGSGFDPSRLRWQMPEGMRGSVARILAAYSPDLDESIKLDLDAPAGGALLDRRMGTSLEDRLVFGGQLPYGAELNKDLLVPVLSTLGRDPETLDTVLAGLAVATNLAMRNAMLMSKESDPTGPRDLLRGEEVPLVTRAIANSAEALAWVIQCGFDGAVAEQAEITAQQETYARVLSLAAALPIISNVPDTDLQWMLEKVTGVAISEIGKVDVPSALDAYGDLETDMPRGALDNVLNLMRQTDYINNSVIAEANGPESSRFQPIPEGAEDRSSLPVRFDTSSDEYRFWVQNFGPGQMLQTTVLLPFVEQWNNLSAPVAP